MRLISQHPAGCLDRSPCFCGIGRRVAAIQSRHGADAAIIARAHGA